MVDPIPSAPAAPTDPAENLGAPLIEVRDVSFGYGAELVLESVNLSIYPRDYLAILGPNGGGKTTLIKLLLGLLAPRSGSIVDRLPDRPGKLGYVPQFSTFDRGFPLRVLEVVRMGRISRRGLLGPYNRDDQRAAEAMLERLHLGALARRPIRELSGGQMQRVLIARALVSAPAILFLDEPTASIDAESRETLRTLLLELNRTIPIVVVTHDPTSIASAVRHVACVNRGLHYHHELTNEALEEAYGCPVELLGHGVPHRVLHSH
ncbi:MAG TPA: metal ABC transporter ATP-binding protein [Thermoanaerobaculia bacterium]|nr:metal ABC transporter ATP-binding protein [Thermoanaerobaculia bacterium]